MMISGDNTPLLAGLMWRLIFVRPVDRADAANILIYGRYQLGVQVLCPLRLGARASCDQLARRDLATADALSPWGGFSF